MSDCHSWFGSARSNRRGGRSRATGAARAATSPSSCRIRRTSDSLTPSASKRESTSRIFRVPHSGCAVRVATTASRRASVLAVFAFGFGVRGAGSSADGPPSRYRRTHSVTVVTLRPNARAIPDMLAPPVTTWSTTRRRSSTG